MKTLVTGGAGFIGSHIVDRLLQDGHDVVVLDDFSTGRPQNLEHQKGQRRLRIVQRNVSDPEPLHPHFEGVDWVFHLAARGDIVPSIQMPMEYFRSNVTGTACVLEACRHAGVKRIVYAASSSCYGIPDRTPTPESAPIRPLYPYALTKYMAEELVLHWNQVYRLPAVCIRIFNAYGPRSRTSGTYGAVFGVFLAQKLKNQPFTVVGDGTQTRDFVFVRDVAAAFVRAAASDLSGEVLNVGADRPVSVNRIVELLGAPKVIHIPKRPGEPDVTHADITKIRRLLGWEPLVPIEEGVAEMLKMIDYWREAPVWTPASIAEATREWFDRLTPSAGDVDKG